MALSSLLQIFYLMYIYLSKNVFDVMTCVPADPPDGQTYMTAGSAAMEPWYVVVTLSCVAAGWRTSLHSSC